MVARSRKFDATQPVQSRVAGGVFMLAPLALAGGCLLVASPAIAACTTSSPANGTSVDCTTGADQTTRVGSGRNNNDVSVTVESNAVINVVGDSAISLGDNATIRLEAGALVTNNPEGHQGPYGTGGNTIEINQNGTIVIGLGASVIKTGASDSAEAINVHGAGNTITNFGTVQASNDAAIWFQDESAAGAKNIVDNFGRIIQTEGGNVIGTSGGVGIQFFNRTGALVQGNLVFAGGNDELYLSAGSVITGNLSGGDGFDTLTLQGVTGSSDVLTGYVQGFETLTKSGGGQWTMSGSLEGFQTVTVESGTLTLTGDNVGFTGSAIVQSDGVLEARAQSLPVRTDPAANVNNIQNDGILRFTQPAGDDATYVGQITGNGSVEKTGGGIVTLAPADPAGNTYGGGTIIREGVLAASADSAIGAAGSGVTLDGGAFGFASSFTLGAGRAVTITSNNGGLYAAPGVTGVVTQAVTGDGTLTKSGDGAVVLTGANTYAGGTTIAAGALQLGDGGTSGSILGDVTNNGALIFNRADVVTFPGTISGSGSVQQVGAGATVFTADNTYTGGTTIAAGTLQLGDGGTSGSIVGDVVDNGALVFNRADTVTFAGVISGTGNVQQIGAGATVLTGDSTYTGGTTIASGVLQLGDGGTSGSIVGDITNNSTLAFNRADTFTVPGVISGSGDVRQIGSGTTVLTADNTYTGGTTIAAGALQLGDGGTSGSILGDVANNGSLIFNRADTVTFPGTISGSGSVQQIGAGATVLTADNTYTGGTTITAGALQLGDGGTSGSILGDVANNGSLIFNRADTVTFPGTISGSGSAQQIGAGATVLTADNTYTGGTTITAGTLQLGNGGTSGSIVGNVSNDGSLVFNRADAVIFDGRISGSGDVQQIGAGTTILTAHNTYTGGTTITAGALQLGNGGLLGSIVGDVVNDGALIFNRRNTVTFPGTISGSGAVRQIGAGATILTANNTYTGVTSVERGALAVGDAAHPGAALSGGGQVNVAAGATFGGYGSVAGDVVNNGTIAVADAFPGFAGGPGGNFTIGGVVTNAGHAQIGGGAVGNNLVVGSWVGQNGTVGVNTVLGGDNSPSDRLLINGGSATGASILQVANVGGLGAVTWGNGIQVVGAINGATTATGAFTLGGPVVAGPYEYTLYRGSRDASDPQSWYLRTDLPTPPTPPTPNPGPGPSPEPTPAPGPVIPNYRPETSLYAALPSMALGYGQSILGTLHERVGEQELLRGRQSASGPSFVNGAWGRIIGQHIDQSTSAGGIYGRGPAYDQDIAAFQFGLDIYRREHADGSRDHAGVYVVVGQSEGSVKHFTGARAGQNRFDAQTIGAYWTHFGATGWYVDAVAQGTWYNARSSSVRMRQISPDGFGVGLSLETGYPLQLGGGWIVEPQAQLVYQSISLDSRYDGAAQVRFSDVQSLAGRIGARLSRTWTLDAENGPKQINVWARANLWNEFLGNPKTWFSSADGFVPFHSEMKGAWTQLGGGVTAQLNGNVALYADASYNIGHGGDRRSWDGKVGVRVNW